MACSCKKGPFQKQLLLSVDWGEVVGKDLWPKVVRVLVLAAAPRSRSWQAIVTDEKVLRRSISKKEPHRLGNHGVLCVCVGGV